ncbi:MAG: hypothetical protein PHO02_06480 [Candidatus Nanoarchaeia archaeon]|nr:hypothetical protein [Candidatus Nanoarchaeia archaeon]
MAKKERIFVLILFLIMIMLTFSGCTPKQEHNGEIETGIQEIIQKPSCQSQKGYLCSASDDCNSPYLDTIESYCCPIECQTCNQSCDDKIETTEDYCSKTTNYTCQHQKICPKNCDDSNSCTDDRCSKDTNFQCKHFTISPCCGDTKCDESSETYKSCPADCKRVFTACEFLPDEDVISTEFTLGAISSDNSTAIKYCKQGYGMSTPWGTSFSVKIYLCNTFDECMDKYNEFVDAEKAERGYSLLEDIKEDCFGIRRNSLMDMSAYLYCNFGKVVYKQSISESGWFSTSELLEKITENVRNKSKEVQ